jgi:hypothetical protein
MVTLVIISLQENTDSLPFAADRSNLSIPMESSSSAASGRLSSSSTPLWVWGAVSRSGDEGRDTINLLEGSWMSLSTRIGDSVERSLGEATGGVCGGDENEVSISLVDEGKSTSVSMVMGELDRNPEADGRDSEVSGEGTLLVPGRLSICVIVAFGCGREGPRTGAFAPETFLHCKIVGHIACETFCSAPCFSALQACEVFCACVTSVYPLHINSQLQMTVASFMSQASRRRAFVEVGRDGSALCGLDLAVFS